jgi:hypothetical protein
MCSEIFMFRYIYLFYFSTFFLMKMARTAGITMPPSRTLRYMFLNSSALTVEPWCLEMKLNRLRYYNLQLPEYASQPHVQKTLAL